MSTNLSHMIGWDGKIIPNASLELEVYVSNESHPLHIFEYTKENNAKGLQFTIPTPEHGWREHTWHSISVPIAETAYSFPQSTPWDRMDRLELYYKNPAPTQPRGDYVRIRNVFLRSTRSYGRGVDSSSATAHLMCRELELMPRRPEGPRAGGGSREASGGSAAGGGGDGGREPAAGGGGGGGLLGDPSPGRGEMTGDASLRDGLVVEPQKRGRMALYGVVGAIVLLVAAVGVGVGLSQRWAGGGGGATSAADYQQLYDAARAQRAARDAEEQTGCSAARWDSAAVHRGGRATTTMTP